jgi:hypothetical protein
MSFYQVPSFIFNPIAKRQLCKGSILLPTDFTGELEQELHRQGLVDTCGNNLEAAIQDPEWWLQYQNEVDWVVAITQGLKENTEWIIDYGLTVARKGVCLLDRITFLEPTRKRELFLKASSLTNLIILSPRPCFRADGKQLKDSVTSAWFVFQKGGAADIKTEIDFEVGWQRPKSICP